MNWNTAIMNSNQHACWVGSATSTIRLEAEANTLSFHGMVDIVRWSGTHARYSTVLSVLPTSPPQHITSQHTTLGVLRLFVSRKKIISPPRLVCSIVCSIPFHSVLTSSCLVLSSLTSLYIVRAIANLHHILCMFYLASFWYLTHCTFSFPTHYSVSRYFSTLFADLHLHHQ